MSELTLSLKNKKQTPQTMGKPEQGIQNFIKPLVSADRVPQTTKHTPVIDSFSNRSYTQRIGAANAAGAGSAAFVGGLASSRHETKQMA